MDILVALSIALSAVVAGYVIAETRSRRKVEDEVAAKAKTLNDNLENFAKAYAQFNDRALDIDSRLTTVEFRLNGTSSKV